ncbi:Ig-like domain-containing protein [Herbiconiux liukaitaii]|uniref:Ig-like domain-containing protein n=1 Tax=Herbiconiux liukaitaii TaxID=3342799 RepID=UPI0035B98C69
MASKPSTAHPRPVRRLLAGAGVFALTAGGLLAVGAPAQAALPAEPVVFSESGFYTWQVPAGVTEVFVQVEGASGGTGGGTNGGAGGVGAVLSGTMEVTEGQEFAVNVGEAGQDAYAEPETAVETFAAPGDVDALALVPGEGGFGYTVGGDGGSGSLLARPGGGGGGSSSIGALVDDPTTVVVAAGGAGGGGRGVVGFCFGGDGGAAGEDGKAPRDDEAASPDGDPDFALNCLAEGAGGEINTSETGDGGEGESVLFLGGGGGGGGAGFDGDGVSGGGGGAAGALVADDDENPATPDGATGSIEAIFGLGGGGGGGAGGGSIFGTLMGAVEGEGDAGDGSVTISYSVEYQTVTTIEVAPETPVYGDDVSVVVSVGNLTTEEVPVGDVQLIVSRLAQTGSASAPGSASALALDEAIVLPLVDGSAEFTFEGGELDAGSYTLSTVYLPAPVSPYASSEADGYLGVLQVPTTTQLAVNPSTVKEGEKTVLTATVVGPSPIVPSGDIAFYYDDALVGIATLEPGSNSIDAEFQFRPVGEAVLTARYRGDEAGNFGASVSNPVDFRVVPTPAPTPTPTPKPTPAPAPKPAGLANTGSGAAALLPWSLLLVGGGALAAGAAGLLRVRARRQG